MKFTHRTPNPVLPQHSRQTDFFHRKERPAREPREKGYLSRVARAHFVAMSSEFVGTFLFLWFAFSGTQIANTIQPSSGPDTGQLFYIALSFGFSLTVNAWVFYRISGGLFNPAVSMHSRISCEAGNNGSDVWLIGDTRSLPRRWSSLGPRCPALCSATPWRHRGCGPRVRHVPWAHVRQYHFKPRNDNCARSLHRDVSHLPPCHYGVTPRS